MVSLFSGISSRFSLHNPCSPVFWYCSFCFVTLSTSCLFFVTLSTLSIFHSTTAFSLTLSLFPMLHFSAIMSMLSRTPLYFLYILYQYVLRYCSCFLSPRLCSAVLQPVFLTPSIFSVQPFFCSPPCYLVLPRFECRLLFVTLSVFFGTAGYFLLRCLCCSILLHICFLLHHPLVFCENFCFQVLPLAFYCTFNFLRYCRLLFFFSRLSSYLFLLHFVSHFLVLPLALFNTLSMFSFTNAFYPPSKFSFCHFFVC
jgi:hypothetical protein